MKFKKRTKRSRYRGNHSHGWGFKKKRRGSGHRGGTGMAGTGKRASQKEQFGLRIAREHGFEKYFGRRGFTSASTAKPKRDQINLNDIFKNFNHLIKAGKEIILENHKILGEGEGFKAIIKAKSASKSAIEKMEKAGGKIILPVVIVKKEVKKPIEKKPVKTEEKKDSKDKK